MKKLIVLGMILLLTGCTIIIKPDCKCECPSNSWYWQQENYPIMPMPDNGNTFTLPNLETYEYKLK